MGQLLARFNALIDSWSKNPGRILMLGLDGAGKSTVLYTLKLGESIETVPTIGFNVEEVQVRGLTFMVWDIGGQDRIRSLWHHYFANTTGLIFVIDSNDRERLKEAANELRGIINADEMVDVPLLVFANKQDLPNALSPTSIADGLGLHLLIHRRWHVQASNALSGEGLLEGLEQLSIMCKDRPRPRRR